MLCLFALWRLEGWEKGDGVGCVVVISQEIQAYAEVRGCCGCCFEGRGLEEREGVGHGV